MTDLGRHIQTTFAATGRMAIVLFTLGALVYLCSGIYSVEPGEIAIHTRFGRIADDDVRPGIHVGLPVPFDMVLKVPVKRMTSIRIDDFAGESPKGELKPVFSLLTGIPTYCLTGDDNIVTISCIGQYTVQNAAGYLFSTVSPEGILRRVAANALIHCLAGMAVDSILTTGKSDIADFVKVWINRRMAEYECGLQVQFLEMKAVNPPALVQAHFRDVIKADIDRKKMLNDAESYQNQRISAVNADAEKIVQEAMAYKTDTLARATGESERFLKRLSEFEKNPALVLQKEYFDFIDILGKDYPNKIIINAPKGHAPVDLRLSWPQ